eukprot:c25745_g1_i1.p1 GENE.c25745_g1_i1~~c25745_g1_i1.p1  ORF type:complete len:1067 (+),score=364.04 c25745_g1_i1:76-3276(+)
MSSPSLSEFLQTVLTSDSNEARQVAASNFADNVRAVGVVALQDEFLLDRIKASLKADGKDAKKAVNERLGGVAAFRALATLFEEIVEPFLIPMLPAVMKLIVDKEKKVATATDKAVKSFFSNITPGAFATVMPVLLDVNTKWQAQQTQVEVLGELAKSSCTVQISRNLPDIIPFVSNLMWHDKPQVKNAATDSMRKIAATVANKDLEPFLPSLIETILVPESAEACVEKLAGTTFVQEMRGDALAIIAPLLMRGLQPQSKTALKRQCARIIENMAKLVDDPREVAPFVPKLVPALARAMDEVPDVECRGVCTKAHDQMIKSMNRKFEQPPKIERSSVFEWFKNKPEHSDFEIRALEHASFVTMSLIEDLKNFDVTQWHMTLTPYLSVMMESEAASAVVDKVFRQVQMTMSPLVPDEADDEAAELLCDCEFSLAYGSKILINNAKLRLRRGVRYGLVGQNDCGKTSLMRAISRNQVDGFPDPTQVRTVFVETDIQGELSNMSVLDYIYADPLLRDCGVERDEMSRVLMSVGFEKDGPASIDKEVGRLSGGWKMKLALARAMLLRADILLLDEPTNHLDVKNRAWVEQYLTSLKNVTSIMVSHDTGFLDRCCTSILQIDSLKINCYKGNISAFVAAVPEAKAYFELQTTSKYRFKFPNPGNLDGITSKGKHIMKMSNITFTYPGAVKPQLLSVSVRVSLSSRVACVGPNGAGKSTMIKLLTGELVPDGTNEDGTNSKGAEVWKHPNCRVAYVAQHAFHHIENHLDKTPNDYIRWRYQYGVDKEALTKDTMKVTDDELAKQKQAIQVDLVDADGAIKKEKRVIKNLTNGRRQEHKGKRNEYEVLLEGGFDVKLWLPESRLEQLGWTKVMRAVDERISSMATQFTRPLTMAFVETHLKDVGLEAEFGSHTKIRALSGGQKVKVVLAAALWKCPHIIIVDEPTNYLDRESLGALAQAIKEFEGGVVIVSHNNEFCKACCPETWVLENHTLNVQGDPEWLAQSEKEKVKTVQLDDDLRDAFGNSVRIVTKKRATRQDMKKLRKRMDEMRKGGEECYTDEEMEKMGLEADPDL